MTSTVTVRKEVMKLKQHLIPKPPVDMLWYFPVNRDKPHGKHGFQIVSLGDEGFTDFKAVPEEQEIRLLREYYEEQIPDHTKHNPNHPQYASFETYLEHNRCKCGYHKKEVET